MADGLFKLPPMMDSTSRLGQALLRDLYTSYDPKSNMSNQDYLQGVENIRPYNMATDEKGQGSYGYVDTFKDPTTVNLSAPYLQDATRILAHESAHVQKNIAERQVSKDKKNDTTSEFLQRQQRGEEGKTLRKQLETNFTNYVKTLEEGKQTPNNVGVYGYGGKSQSWEERFADLQSLESQLPRGKTLLDTPLGQNVFNTPDLKRYWLQTTLPLQAKALEQNPELEQNFFDKLDIFSKTFKDEAKTRSYANAAMSALKKAMTKEQTVSPMYADPFADTTK
jgi:hypothetical protein